MNLLFIHGWAFDGHFWNRLLPLLPECRAQIVDRGFFGSASALPQAKDERTVLVGHSLGFLHGMNMERAWRAVIAINGFAHFVPDCFSAAALREMRGRLQKDTQKTVQTFHDTLGTTPPFGTPNAEKLRAGLDELLEGPVLGNLEKGGAPLLSLASHNDPLVPESASRLLGPSTLFHPTGGHVLPLTDPAWCANAMKTFLRDLP